MGMQMFTESGQFNPADWGLKAGDMIQGVVVGAGAGGAAGEDGSDGADAGKGASGGSGVGYGAGGGGGRAGSDEWDMGGTGGDAGEVKFFTMKLTTLDPISVTIGKGGKGGTRNQAPTAGGDSSFGSVTAKGGEPNGTGSSFSPGGWGSNTYQKKIEGGLTTTVYGEGGGGGGGYIPGSNVWGGAGGKAGWPGSLNGGAGGGCETPGTGMGSPSGVSGGIGDGLVIVCW